MFPLSLCSHGNRAAKKARIREARAFFQRRLFQRERLRDPAFLAVLRLRVAAPRALVVRVEARDAEPLLFLPRTEVAADVTALAPRRMALAVLRAALRSGLVISMSPEPD
jgi:hypothetical protein